MTKYIRLIILVLVIALFGVSCAPDDPITEDIYTTANIYSWNGTAWTTITGGGIGVEVDPIWSASPSFGITALDIASWNAKIGVELDPVFSGSPAFGITGANIITWNAHPGLTTGTHGVAGTIVGTSDAQALTNKQLTMNNNEPIYWKTFAGVPQDTINLVASNTLMINNPSGSVQLRGGAINLNPGTDEEIYLWGNGIGTGRELVLYSSHSDAINTTRDSPTLHLATSYWDGGAGVGWAGDIIHDMITAGAAPKSRLKFDINNVNVLYMESNNGTVSTTSSGDLYLGANHYRTTNLALYEGNANTIWLRDSTLAAYRDFRCNVLYPDGGIGHLWGNYYIQTVNADNGVLYLKARDNGVGTIEVARLQGAADPYFSMGGTQQFKFYNSGNATAGGNFDPVGAGVYSSGTASDYWNDISYKTLTDRGCLGWFDGGVEMQNGTIVSDVNALLAIKPDFTKLTVYGVPMLDYSTMPKAVYKPAPIATKDVFKYSYVDTVADNGTVTTEEIIKLAYKAGDKMGTDGAETTALISIMIGAIKEQQAQIDTLEAEIDKLKAQLAVK